MSATPTDGISKAFAAQFDSYESHSVQKVADVRDEIIDIADRSMKVTHYSYF